MSSRPTPLSLQPLLPPKPLAQALPAFYSDSGSHSCPQASLPSWLLPSLTFVPFGSLGARWSLQVESERTGTWKPTVHSGSARAEGLWPEPAVGAGAQHLPEAENPGRPCSPEGHTQEGSVSACSSSSPAPGPALTPPSLQGSHPRAATGACVHTFPTIRTLTPVYPHSFGQNAFTGNSRLWEGQLCFPHPHFV